MAAVVLRVDNARERMAAAWRMACELLELGKPVRVEVGEARNVRSLDQNAMFHAICGDIAKQRTWAGKKLDGEGWKPDFEYLTRPDTMAEVYERQVSA